ncbi:MAG: arginine--tRNA ligase [Gammaproteobacteria bacterium]|nr:arginine--tRNA ligase [Gammaproteobacteria bacterium]MBL7000881.1 arginine--tRNA ligase [Gammaproteobacteria bacterium]
MKQQLEQHIQQSIQQLIKSGQLAADFNANIQLAPGKDAAQGDYATNLCLVNAKQLGMAPRQLAEKLLPLLATPEWLEKVEIAGPGFINFFLRAGFNQSVVQTILQQGEKFGRSESGQNRKIQIEFVSANPTGPLHVGHGRGAAYGATLANLLKATGYNVQCEYYVNDAGRQMDILGTSVWLRYLDLAGEQIVFPSNAYQGDYIWDIAANLHREHGDDYRIAAAEVFLAVTADAPEGDKEKHIDDLISNAKQLLGAEKYRFVFDLALNTLVAVIRKDLSHFGVEFDEWFSERQLTDEGVVDRAITVLQQKDKVYEKDGALWFRSSAYGDEKDRVVRRDNGQTTYFASDIAYHMNKFDRGFEQVINIWGADHHGYIPRVKASLQAMDYPADKLEIVLVQFANLYENGQMISMSTRSGDFVPLRTLREDVGNDAARFFYVMRKADQHMDFDLNLAREQTSDNPVFYVQYAHARICSVEKQCAEQQITIDLNQLDLERLENSHEQALLKQLTLYPDRVLSAAERREPHIVINYLRELAQQFHSWYNAHKFIVEDEALRNARVALAFATRQVLKNGLQLMGVSAPQQM